MDTKKWTIGESVVVKPGIADPDIGYDIAGWQGRIIAIFDEEEIVQIQWDSVTLQNMSEAHIAWSEEEGLSWSEMNLGLEDVEPATARDTEEEVAKTIDEIESRSGWFHIGGEQGKRIQALVNSAKSRDEFALLQTWHAYLVEHLVFPFVARVQEEMRGPVRQGARVNVLAIISLDRTYGTIVAVKHKNGLHELPLCDLEAVGANTETRQVVDDYSVWFANR
jgi:Calcium binding